MKSRLLSVVIVDDGRLARCEAGCGTDWSRAENLEAARSALSARFGESVTLSFCDLSHQGDCSPHIEERIRSEGHSLPLLVIDGEPRVAGLFDIKMLADLVEAQLEMNRA